jgi:hypothetical protein
MPLLIALLACRGAPSDPTTTEVPSEPGPSGDTGGERLEARVTRSSLVPTVHTLEWTTEDAQASWVEVTDRLGTWSTPAGPATTDHHHVLLGLKAGRPVRLTPVLEGPQGIVRGYPIELEVPAAPPQMPAFRVQRLVTADLPERFWSLFYYAGGVHNHAVIIDQDGDPVWWVTGPDPTIPLTTVKPSLDGRSVLTAHFRDEAEGIRRTPLAAMSLSEQRFTATHDAHHDIVDLPDGRLAYLAHVFEDRQWGDAGTLPIQLDVVYELDDGATADQATLAFDARTLDIEVGPVCSHTEPGVGPGAATQWGHANSLLWDGRDDSLVIHFRNLDTLMKVDRRTGARVWSLGGLSNDFASSAPDAWFDHGHTSQWGPHGLTIFSNELHHDESILYHYAVDEQARTIDLSWSYPEPRGQQVAALGDVDRTPDGAYLAAWSGLGALELITPSGDVVWRVTSPSGVSIPRAVWVEDLYDLSAGTPLEP